MLSSHPQRHHSVYGSSGSGSVPSSSSSSGGMGPQQRTFSRQDIGNTGKQHSSSRSSIEKQHQHTVVASPASSASSSNSASTGSSSGSGSGSIDQVVVMVKNGQQQLAENESMMAQHAPAASSSTSTQSLKSARRHSETGMSTPTVERDIVMDSSMLQTQGGGGGNTAEAQQQQSGSARGSASPSRRPILSHRDTSKDGETRPARRKVMRHDNEGHPHGMDSQSESERSVSRGIQLGERAMAYAYAHAAGAQGAQSQEQAQSHSTAPTLSILAGRPGQQQQQVPSMDIATYPTPALLHALAALLTRITEANDARRTAREREREREREGQCERERALALEQDERQRALPPDQEYPAQGSPSSHFAQPGLDASASFNPDTHQPRHSRSQSIASSTGSSSRQPDPVTPAVPLSSPASSTGKAGTTEEGRERKKQFLSSMGTSTGYPFPDFEERMKRVVWEQSQLATSGTSTSTSEASARASASKEEGSSTSRASADAEGETASMSKDGETGASRAGAGAGAGAGADADTASAMQEDEAIMQDEGAASALSNSASQEDGSEPRLNFHTANHVHPLPSSSFLFTSSSSMNPPPPSPFRSSSSSSYPSHPSSSATAALSQRHPRTILTSAANALSTPNATLCFHARNVPSITIESYLVRISKYCPTTNEVFISLLVYFDRMSHLPALGLQAAGAGAGAGPPNVPAMGIDGHDGHDQQHRQQHQEFAVDSFNIHRLIISGITVASKFFSDVFYTNSRYAKVGGLPLPELNALEIQFLLLNGFDLAVSPDEIQRYADCLLLGVLPPIKEVELPCCILAAQQAVVPSSASAQRPIIASPAAGRVMQNKQEGSGTAFRSPAAQYHQAILSQQHLQSTPHPPAAPAAGGGSVRPNKIYTNRSASESSTSASEASTVVPSESSVDTERIGGGGGTEGEEDENEQGEARMDVPVAQQGMSNGDHDMGEQDADDQKEPTAAAGSSSSNSGVRTPGAKSVLLPATIAPYHQQQFSSSPATMSKLQPFPSQAEDASTRAANVGDTSSSSALPATSSTHKRHNSRTREWTAQQRAQLQRESGYDAEREHGHEEESAGSSPSRAAHGADSTVLEDGDTIMAD